MKPALLKSATWMLAGIGLALPLAVQAQSLPYGDVSAGAGDPGDGEDAAASDDEGGTRIATHRARKVHVTPYIEAQQVVTAELSPNNETLTYSTLAAGLDASIAGRNAEGGVSVRYERRFGWGSNKIADSDVVSGIARGSVSLVPRTLTLEAGASAARMHVENNGSTVNGIEFGDSATQVYSLYAGPSLQTQIGDVVVQAHYRAGFTKVTTPKAVASAPGQNPVDLFSQSVSHNALVHAGIAAGTVLPIGLGVGAGWNREDVHNLDQRVDDKHVRGDVSLPVGSAIELVAGLGYEKVEISGRDALRDSITGLPLRAANGHLITDKSQPRQIAYQSDGLIWDAGVLWRPSKRTTLEAHFGRRYGSSTYYGNFSYAPSARTSLNVSVYDNYSGLGGTMVEALSNLPTQFDGLHNPLTGGVGTCVASTGAVRSGGGTCLNGALASVRSSAFRARGAMASFGVAGNRLQYGVAGGYDRRKFAAAPGTVLALANGVIDENYWISAYLNGRIDRNSSFGTNVWANWYQSGDALAGNSSTIGATAAYYRSLTSRLTATAAVGVDGVNREQLQDIWSASVLVGLRYSF